MNKNIAIVVGIIVVGAVLYASGVFAQPWEEPIISNTVDGSFKHTFEITYVDGTSETVTSDSILAKILHNDAEVITVKPYLYIKPLNPSELDYTTIEISFPDEFYFTWEIECTGGALYSTLTDYIVYQSSGSSYLTDPLMSISTFPTINLIGWYTFDMDSVFQEAGHYTFDMSIIDNLVGVTTLGLPGTFELKMTYHGDIEYKILEVNTDVYTFPAPIGTMVWTFTTGTDQGPSDITFEWDMPTP